MVELFRPPHGPGELLITAYEILHHFQYFSNPAFRAPFLLTYLSFSLYKFFSDGVSALSDTTVSEIWETKMVYLLCELSIAPIVADYSLQASSTTSTATPGKHPFERRLEEVKLSKT